ncbi:hypothetical protein SUGI_0294790 [Cryptomeria japonica]|uniref:RING-H2 finger protein ATL52-like n=1 Tax=Cryptomeria japonica TaxID=3369 RepID=UPI0024089D00|nr:RING-H2 finger protein ATL52-like [Cryptomeria japonica]GLJ17040.1 hypothetical protein SUGI_0294790 [Cryptomeria japonica]
MIEGFVLHVLFIVCISGTGAATSILVYLVFSAFIEHKSFNYFGFLISSLALISFLMVLWGAKLIAGRSQTRRTENTDVTEFDPPSDYIINLNLRPNPYLVGETTVQYKESDAVEMCVVCQLDFQEHERVIFPMGCKHYFHKECITHWLLYHHICPVCRRVIPHGPDSATRDEISVIHIIITAATTSNGDEGDLTTVDCSQSATNPTVTETVDGDSQLVMEDKVV